MGDTQGKPDTSDNTGRIIGVVGLGTMGAGMAHNLQRAGFSLVVFNRTRERTDPFVEAGAFAAADLHDLAERCDVVLVCVSDTPDVEAVLFREDGLEAGLHPGSLVIDCSTVSPEATRAWADRLAVRGVEFVDAPVSGGAEGARNGTLSVMVGGSEAAFERAQPYLCAIGSTITHVGPIGAGQTCKLVNQILVVVNMLAVSEALVFAKAGGLDLEKTIEAVRGGAAGSWMLANRGPQVIAGDWRPGFTVDLQQKDLRLVTEAADAMGVPILATSQVFQLYRTLQREGLGAEGNHALVKAIERLAGIDARTE